MALHQAQRLEVCSHSRGEGRRAKQIVRAELSPQRRRAEQRADPVGGHPLIQPLVACEQRRLLHHSRPETANACNSCARAWHKQQLQWCV